MNDITTTDSPGADSIARQTLAELEARLADYQQQRVTKGQELDALRITGPRQVLQGSSTQEQISLKLAELRDQLEMVDSIIAELDRQLPPARHMAKLEEYDAMEREADRMDAQNAPRVAKRERILAELEELEGPSYMANPLSAQIARQAQRLRDSAQDLRAKLDRPVDPTERRNTRRY